MIYKHINPFSSPVIYKCTLTELFIDIMYRRCPSAIMINEIFFTSVCSTCLVLKGGI